MHAAEHATQGELVYVHCKAGRGRSTTLGGCLQLLGVSFCPYFDGRMIKRVPRCSVVVLVVCCSHTGRHLFRSWRATCSSCRACASSHTVADDCCRN